MPDEIPDAIANYLTAIALENHDPAYLQVTADGHLIASGGHLQKYGLHRMQPDEYIGESFYYLDGFFPLAQTEVMHHLQLDDGPVVDIHAIAVDASQWVLVLDTTAEAERVQRLQQKANDLSLLRQQYAKLLNQNLTSQQTKAASQEAIEASDRLDTQPNISVLIFKFCGAQADILTLGEPAALKAINASLSFITQVIVEEGGIINHIIGGTVAAFFGLLPTHQSAAQQAVYAAKRLIARLMAEAFHYGLSAPEIPQPSAQSLYHQLDRLGVGASIATGRAAAGVLYSQSDRSINAIGDPIQAVGQISRYIQPGAIAIDSATFEAIDLLQQQAFHAWTPGPVAVPTASTETARIAKDGSSSEAFQDTNFPDENFQGEDFPSQNLYRLSLE